MIKYIAKVNTDTGEIISLAFARGSNNPAEGLDNSDQLYIIHITEEIGPGDLFMKTHYYNFDTQEWVVREDPPNPIATWNGSSWDTDLEGFRNLVRESRDRLLAECDWTQMPDVTLNEDQKNGWLAYRQQLRDLPASLDGTITRLENVPWPTPPSNLPASGGE